MRRALALCLVAAAVPARAAPQDVLVPDGEPASILDEGHSWTLREAPHVEPSGKLIYACASDGIHRWDALTGEALPLVLAGKPCFQSEASSGAARIFVQGTEGGYVVDGLRPRPPVRSVSSAIEWRYAISADGKRIALALFGNPEIDIEDVDGGQVAKLRLEQAGFLNALALSPDGKRLVAVIDKKALVYDVGVAVPHGFESTLYAPPVAFSPDGKLLVVGGASSPFVVSLPDYRRTELDDGNAGLTRDLRFLADGTLLEAASDALTTWRFDGGAPRAIGRVSLGGATQIVDQRVALRGPDLVDLASGRPFAHLYNGRHLVNLAWWPKHEDLAAVTENGDLVQWNVQTSLERKRPPDDPTRAHVDALAVSSDGKQIAVGLEHRVVISEPEHFSGAQSTIDLGDSMPQALAFDHRGQYLAVSDGPNVRVFDVRHGTELCRPPPDKKEKKDPNACLHLSSADMTAGLALVQAGSPVVVVGRASDVLLANFKDPAADRALPVSGLRCFAVRRDESTLFAADAAGMLHIYDLPSGKATATVDVSTSRRWVSPTAIVDIGDGVAIGWADGSVTLWRPGKALRVLVDGSATRGGVRLMAWDPALKLLAVSDDAGRVDLLALPTGEKAGFALLGEPWAAWTRAAGGKLYRDDDGTLLQQLDPDGREAPIAPPAPSEGASQLVARVDGINPPGEADDTGSLIVSVHNAGKGAAYWVRVEVRALPPGLIAIPPPVALRVDPGQQLALPIRLSSVSTGAPAPSTARIGLALTEAHGAEQVIPVEIERRAPHVEFAARTAGTGGDAVVQLRLVNDGNEDSGQLTIRPSFRNGKGAPIAVAKLTQPPLSPSQSVELPIPIPGEMRSGAFTLHVDVTGDRWPTHEWVRDVPELHVGWLPNPWALFGSLLSMVLGAGVALTLVQRRRALPSLRSLALEELRDVDRDLRARRRLHVALDRAGLPAARWERAVAAAGSPEAVARAFAAAIPGASLGAKLDGHDAWTLTLPGLRLRFPEETVVAVAATPLDSVEANRLAAAIYRNGAGPTTALLVDLSRSARLPEWLAETARRVVFVVLATAQLRDLLMDDDPIAVLQSVIADQRPVVELSPYQTGLGVDDDSLFFGRRDELARLADGRLHNALIIAPRQMGKTSLLKMLARRMKARSDVVTVFHTLSGADLVTELAAVRDVDGPVTPQDFARFAAGTREQPRLWLIDEAGAFSREDQRRDYPVSRIMRALAADGRAYFVLAGAWHLYDVATHDAESPLRNFGNIILLGPLERRDARDLVVKPLATLRLGFDEPATIDYLLDETGCRANLLSIACDALVTGLDEGTRLLTRDAVERVLRSSAKLEHSLSSWRDNKLDRAVIHAALLLGAHARPSEGEVRDCLASVGIRPGGDALERSFNRLKIGYILQPDRDGRLYFPVPLLERYIARAETGEDGMRRALEQDARDLEQAATVVG